MAITQETIVLNDYGLTERRRTTSKGTKSRFTIQIRSEPMIHNFSALELGRGPADAIKDVIIKQIQGVSADASLATIKKRESAARRLAGAPKTKTGKPKLGDTGTSIIQRYSGGRIGLLPPAPGSTKLFNDSGRLSRITIQPNRAYADDSAWEVNVPANRLDPTTFANKADYLKMVELLQKYVPALGRDAESLLEDDRVDKALRDSIEFCLGEAAKLNKELRAALRKSQWQFAGTLARGFFELTL